VGQQWTSLSSVRRLGNKLADDHCDTFKLQKANQRFPLWLSVPLQHPATVPSTTATRKTTAIIAIVIPY